jgi:hypothetical protein
MIKKRQKSFFCQAHIGDHVVGFHVGWIGFLGVFGEKQYRMDVEKFEYGSTLVLRQDNDFEEEFNRFSDVRTKLTEKIGLNFLSFKPNF